MALPDVTINFSGKSNRAFDTGDGVCGLLELHYCNGDQFEELAVTGAFDTPFLIRSLEDLKNNGVEEDNFPVVYHDAERFLEKAGKGSSLYLMIMPVCDEIIFETHIDNTEVSEGLQQLVDFSGATIRTLGINVNTDALYYYIQEYPDMVEDLVPLLVSMELFCLSIVIHEWMERKTLEITPVRCILPMQYNSDFLSWYREIDAQSEVHPRTSHVGVSDLKLQNKYCIPAIGLTLGIIAATPVHQSIARVRDGAVSYSGWIGEGMTIEEARANGSLDECDDLRFIIFRTYPGKSGYYFNDDFTLAGPDQAISKIHLTRVLDKAVIVIYNTYVTEMLDTVETNPDGTIPASVCSYYENLISRTVHKTMQGEIDQFSVHINPAQNLLRESRMKVECSLLPKGVIDNININLGFETR